MFRHKKIILSTGIYLYVVLPCLIFVMGWLKWCWAVILGISLIFAVIRCIKEDPFDYASISFRNNRKQFIIAFFLICFWVYISGIGGLCYQNSDHEARTAIYRSLVEYSWPVISNDGERGLIYYIGYWLPSALIGKLFGFEAGYIFQSIWAVLGIFIVYYLICLWRNKVSIWPLIIFIFFSGLDYIGVWILSQPAMNLNLAEHLEWWAVDFQYSSMTTQLFWVFNQSVPAWVVIAMIFVNSSNKKNMLFLMGCIILTSTFPFVGLLPFVIYYLLKDFHLNSGYFRTIFSVQNIVGIFTVGLISVIYLLGNLSANSVGGDSVANTADTSALVLKYILFYILEFGVYAFFVYRDNKRNPIYYIVVIMLIICPFIKVGGAHDFCMRASIPSLFILMLMCISSLERMFVEGKKYIYFAFIFVLGVGAITPFNEIHRSVRETINLSTAGLEVTYPEWSIEEVLLSGANFSGDVASGLFYNYFARSK